MIKANGGREVANYDSVVMPEVSGGILKTALNAYGHLDILFNNVGILHDKMSFNMTNGEWKAVFRDKHNGHFYTPRAAWIIFPNQKSGRIIDTFYISELGHRGQHNYFTAKKCPVGFSLTMALEMGHYGDIVNAIQSNAVTQMIMSDDMMLNAERAE